jgi:hypothetical protein
LSRKKEEAAVRSNPPADYHSLIARVVSELADNTPDARQALYDRARTALATQLRGKHRSTSQIVVEQRALEATIRRVEADARGVANPRFQFSGP